MTSRMAAVSNDEPHDTTHDEVVIVDGTQLIMPLMLVQKTHAGMNMGRDGAQACLHLEGEDPHEEPVTMTLFFASPGAMVKVVQEICRVLFDEDGVEQVKQVFMKLIPEQVDTDSVIMKHYARFAYPEQYDDET